MYSGRIKHLRHGTMTEATLLANWQMDNLTLWDFCVSMIGRAYIIN